MLEKIIEKQLEEKMLSREDVNIYRYGYILVCEVLLNSIIALIIGMIFQSMTEVLLFLCIYIPLRSFCGGWHADKIWKCTIFSNVILIIMLAIAQYAPLESSIHMMLVIFSVSCILLLALAPVDTASKPISPEEKNLYKKKIRMILLIHFLLMGAMTALGVKKMMYTISFAYATQVVFIMAELTGRKRTKAGQEADKVLE